MNQTQKTLLGVLAQSLFGIEYEIPENTDWQALFQESKVQAVAPMVFSSVADKCRESDVFQEWKSVTMRSMQNNMKIQYQHDALHKLLTSNDIPYCVIKGCTSAKDYPDPLLRSLGDVDFLVSDEYWEQTKQLLVEDGFIATGENHDFHLGFHKGRIVMEMHHEPFGLKGEGAQALLEIVPELIEKSKLIQCDTATFRGPDDFGHGTVILLHAYRHLIDTGVGVRHLCDWAVFISQFTDEAFSGIFCERFEALGIWKLAQVFGATAHCYLGAPYCSWMGKIDKKMCRMLMLDILNGGNFGKGGHERTTQNLSVYADENELATGNTTIQMIRGLNRTAIQRYPRLMKFRIFRPFGWIILGVRYIFRVLTGRRKKAPTDTMQMASMRRKLYQQLGVFEKA